MTLATTEQEQAMTLNTQEILRLLARAHNELQNYTESEGKTKDAGKVLEDIRSSFPVDQRSLLDEPEDVVAEPEVAPVPGALRVRLVIDLDLPDECAQMTQPELRQLVFDDYIHYAAVSHMADATHWCARGNVGSDAEREPEKLIFLHHRLWGKLCAKATWSMTTLTPVLVSAPG